MECCVLLIGKPQWLVRMVQSYYGVYGGATAQYPVYGSGAAAAAFYPYLQYGEGSGGGGTSGGYSSGQGYGVNYPPQAHLFQYSPIASTAAATAGYAQHYGTPAMSLAPSPALQSGWFLTFFSFPFPDEKEALTSLTVCFAVPQA